MRKLFYLWFLELSIYFKERADAMERRRKEWYAAIEETRNSLKKMNISSADGVAPIFGWRKII